jgi:leucyl/phenylalanyl-tRNA--protein transferase
LIQSVPKIIPAESLLGAYTHGVFPMAHEGEIQWFRPERRGLSPFEVKWNTAFRNVMLGCAGREDTWIDEVILESYCALHESGFAHSVECWDNDGLQGGLYGVALPGVFFGESMFSRKTDASKVALVALVARLREQGFQLLDTQWMTPHLRQFGGYELSRVEYQAALRTALGSGKLLE